MAAEGEERDEALLAVVRAESEFGADDLEIEQTRGERAGGCGAGDGARRRRRRGF